MYSKALFRCRMYLEMVLLVTVISLLTLSGVVQGAPNSRSRLAASNPLISEEQVDQWLRLWQDRLRLQDWRVDAKIVRIWDLDPHTLGHIHWSKSKKTATIKVLNPVDYQIPQSRIAEDIEMSIVHELVHLQLSALTQDDRISVANEEVVVTKIAMALMGLGASSPALSAASSGAGNSH